MREIEIRAFTQNASAVVQEVVGGEVVVITDRGRPVAQMIPLAQGHLAVLEQDGLVRHRKRRLSEIGPPVKTPVALSQMVLAARDHERYSPRRPPWTPPPRES
ncbi:MAG: type II toxin-antitoxin system prevent-host-death family antitoxin [Thermoleophilia bacterium]